MATAVLWSLGGVLIKWVDWHPVAIAGTRSLIGAALIGIAFRHELRFTWSLIKLAVRSLMPAP